MNKMIAGRYEVIRSLGEGGMADVYLANDTILHREVAIKILRGELSNDPVTLLRFQREASAVSKLNHPNVVDVYDVGESEGHHYIVMEYIRGRTLKQLISQRGAIDKKEAVDIMLQLTSAVLHAHQNAIIHRDIKPQNVLVKDDGTIKITDFGIALAHDAIQLTQSDAVLGSAHYLAPETTRGEPATNQIDVYALGIVFYELLSGSVPFSGDNPVQIAMKHLQQNMPSIKEFNPTLPQSIANIIAKATVKNRRLRYQSVEEMYDDLLECLTPEHAHDDPLVLEEELNDPTLTFQEAPRQNTERKSMVHKKKKKRKIYVLIFLFIGMVGSILFLNFMKNKKIIIPNIIDKSAEEAEQLLLDVGFSSKQLQWKKELSEDKEKGIVFACEPNVGKEITKKDTIVITISSGLYQEVSNYQGELFEQAKEKILREFPNAQFQIEKQATTAYEKGTIIKQNHTNIGEKVDPQKPIVFEFVIAESPSVTIENIVGLSVEEAKKKLDSYGVAVVTIQKSTIGMSDEEIENLKKGIVVEVDPKEGTKFVQDGSNNYITLYYY